LKECNERKEAGARKHRESEMEINTSKKEIMKAE
jgi:hypothetical protein